MCLMCEEEAMYQLYLDYLARKAAGEGGQKSGTAAPANAFACEPAPESAAPSANPAAPSKVA